MFGVRRRFQFSYGIGNGVPLAVFQRVLLASEQSVNSAALMLHEVTDDAILGKEHCVALVQESDITNERAEEGRDWLSRICHVVAIDDPESPDKLSEIAPQSCGGSELGGQLAGRKAP